jgi:hypothetical protein
LGIAESSILSTPRAVWDSEDSILVLPQEEPKLEFRRQALRKLKHQVQASQKGEANLLQNRKVLDQTRVSKNRLPDKSELQLLIGTGCLALDMSSTLSNLAFSSARQV